jgi:hypothetical protein
MWAGRAGSPGEHTTGTREKRARRQTWLARTTRLDGLRLPGASWDWRVMRRPGSTRTPDWTSKVATTSAYTTCTHSSVQSKPRPLAQ